MKYIKETNEIECTQRLGNIKIFYLEIYLHTPHQNTVYKIPHTVV